MYRSLEITRMSRGDREESSLQWSPYESLSCRVAELRQQTRRVRVTAVHQDTDQLLACLLISSPHSRYRRYATIRLLRYMMCKVPLDGNSKLLYLKQKLTLYRCLRRLLGRANEPWEPKSDMIGR